MQALIIFSELHFFYIYGTHFICVSIIYDYLDTSKTTRPLVMQGGFFWGVFFSAGFKYTARFQQSLCLLHLGV